MKDPEIQTEKLSNPATRSAKRPLAVGSRLRALRLLGGKSIHEIAKAAGMSYQGLQALETGGDFRMSTFSRVATALAVNVVDLLDEERFNVALAAAADHSQGD